MIFSFKKKSENFSNEELFDFNYLMKLKIYSSSCFAVSVTGAAAFGAAC
jgi:hypothetical protein